MSLMAFNRKIVIGLLLLLFCSLLLIVSSIFIMPRGLVKSRVCSMPLGGSLLSNVCSSTSMQQDFSDDGNMRLSQDTSYLKTLNIATSIHVVSLARRTDRRRTMDVLGEALHFDWSYFDALDKDDALVDSIIQFIVTHRAASSEFDWPEALDDTRLRSLGVESQTYKAPPVKNLGSDSLVCATEDNTIPLYANASTIPFHMRLSRGMIACWYSHVRLMADIVARTAYIREDTWDGREGAAVVFEDDIDVEWDLKERIERMWVDVPRDWDIVMLGHCWSNESTHPPIAPASPLHPSHSPKCTHGYVLSPPGARRLLTHLTYPPFAFSRALDQAIAHLISTRRIRSFSVVPSIVVQRRSGCLSGNATECLDEAAMDGDSDIWVNGGRRGSRWRDSLQDSTLERIRKAVVKVL